MKANIDRTVALILEEPFETNGEVIASDYTWYVFAEEILSKFKKGILSIPLKNVSEIKAKNVYKTNLNINKRPYFDSFKTFYLTLYKNHKQLKKNTKTLIKEADIIVVRAPSPMTPYVVKYSYIYKKPIITIFAGDFYQAADITKAKNILVKIIYKIMRYFINNEQNKIATKSKKIIVYGEALKEKYLRYNEKCIIMRSGTINEKDLFYRENTCLREKIVLVRIGSYMKIKGHITLIKAVNELINEGLQIELQMYGKIADAMYFQELKKIAGPNIYLNPAVPFGEQLFEIYKNADIQIISSITEGIPRTILEGASFSLPLIATKVGGIASVITDYKNGILIEPENVKELKGAIKELIKNEELRKNIIKNGYDIACKNTIEKLSEQVAEEINNV